MKKQSYILKIGVALTLLLFSVATRSNMFAVEHSAAINGTGISIDNASGILTSLDNANYISLICEDDTSDDDDNDDAYLSLSNKRKVRELYREKHFCYHLQSVSSSFFFSSDTSPPLV